MFEQQPILVGFSIRSEAMDVARSAPQGAHYYHADLAYYLALYISVCHPCCMHSVVVVVEAGA